MNMKQAFSLVELSIVLVILGLLTGGILTGQNLIRAAELRSVVTEFQNYQSAINTFRDKYFDIPGDMSNAEDFWGTMATGTCPNATAGTGTQTCNGDGDGSLGVATAASRTGESFTFWQHLANAGLIDGSYTGIAGTAGAADHDGGVNSPKSKLSNAGWGIRDSGTMSGDSNWFDGVLGNNLLIGALADATDNSRHSGDIFVPEEAWNIDTKVDDGMPAIGRLVVRNRVNCAVDSAGAALTTGAAMAAKLDSKYNLTETAQECALAFRQLF